jgi:hypothetical protein
MVSDDEARRLLQEVPMEWEHGRMAPACARDMWRQCGPVVAAGHSYSRQIMSQSYSVLPNRSVRASNGIDFVYRDAGQGEVPLVLLQHFRGNLDNWDPGN